MANDNLPKKTKRALQKPFSPREAVTDACMRMLSNPFSENALVFCVNNAGAEELEIQQMYMVDSVSGNIVNIRHLGRIRQYFANRFEPL